LAASPKRGVFVRGIADAGLSASTMFGLSSTAQHGSIGLSAEREAVAFPVLVDLEFGKTSGGLTLGEVTVGAAALWTTGRFRLGGGVDGGYGWIERAPSSSLRSIEMFALDAFAVASFDVVDLDDRRAVFLSAKPSAGVRWGETFFAFGHGTLAFRGAISAGVRF
jgi:hypothetical protein